MYPNSSGSTIGTLLRMIREDQTQGVAATPPGTQPGAATRELVQQPLSSPEDPGSSRVVSVRPEGVTQTGTPGVAPVAPASPAAVTTPSVVAPVAPVAPQPAPNFSAPSAGQPAPSQPSRPSATAPSIGTSIRPAAQAVLGASTQAYKPAVANFIPQRLSIPQPSRIGPKSVGGQGVVPTPTPAPQNTNKKPSPSQQINASFYRA